MTDHALTLGRPAALLLAALAILLCGSDAARAAIPFKAIHVPTSQRTYLARLITATRVYATPGGRRLPRQSATATWAGGQVQLPITNTTVLRDGSRWIQILLPRRPNGSRGWVRPSTVQIHTTSWRVAVSLGRREVRVYQRGKLVRRFGAVVGAPGTPTPVGLAAVSEIVRQPDPAGYVGPWILHLTAHSTVYKTFDGGDGDIGLHGRGPASLGDPLGTARSHGCVRVSNANVSWLAQRLEAGVPVRVAR